MNKHKEDFDIDIMRPTMWGNPFIIGKDGTRREVINKHKEYLRQQLRTGNLGVEHLFFLQGKKLGCCCKPKPCHGDNYKELLDELASGIVTSRWCKPMGHTAYDYCSEKIQNKLDKIQKKKRVLVSGAELNHNTILTPVYASLAKAKYKNQTLISKEFEDLPENLSDSPISKILNPFKYITLYGIQVDVAESVFMLSDIKVAKRGEEKTKYPDINMRVVSSAMFARGVVTTPPHLLAVGGISDRYNKKIARYISRAAGVLGLPIAHVAMVDIASREVLGVFKKHH